MLILFTNTCSIRLSHRLHPRYLSSAVTFISRG